MFQVICLLETLTVNSEKSSVLLITDKTFSTFVVTILIKELFHHLYISPEWKIKGFVSAALRNYTHIYYLVHGRAGTLQYKAYLHFVQLGPSEKGA